MFSYRLLLVLLLYSDHAFTKIAVITMLASINAIVGMSVSVNERLRERTVTTISFS